VLQREFEAAKKVDDKASRDMGFVKHLLHFPTTELDGE